MLLLQMPIDTFDHAARVFGSDVWAALGVTLLAFACSFALIYSVYSRVPELKDKLGPLHSYFDILLRCFACVTEPDALPGFPSSRLVRVAYENFKIKQKY